MDIKKLLLQNKHIRMFLSLLRDRLIAHLGTFTQSYSLEGEDMILAMYFGDRKYGFYVDIGANDPFKQSNTAHFYQKGWHGINIDASPEAIRQLSIYRLSDENIQALVSNVLETKTLYKFNNSALNTTLPAMAKEYAKTPGYYLVRKQKLKTTTLKKILDKYIESGKHIDFMSIDVEGAEMNVLRSNDWKKYRPEIIVVESLNIDNIESVKNARVYKYLTKRNYRCFAKTSTNLFFKDKYVKK